MNIIIPMAGQGSRFSKSGFYLPKPLIKIANKPMYRHAVDCLPLDLATNVIFILRKDTSADLEKDIKKNYCHLSNISILILEEETEGQAETILRSHRYLNLSQPTLIHNCDTFITENFKWSELLKKDIEGAIVLFTSQEARWSYAKLDKKNEYIIDIQEKKVISPYASTGTYFFNNTSFLLDTIQYTINNNIRQNNEFYLSTIYQLMIGAHKKIIPLWTKNMKCFGTPYDLVTSLNTMILEKR